MESQLFVGIMSGTSLDGVDAVLVDLGEPFKLLNKVHIQLTDELRNTLFELNTPGGNELHIAAQAAIELSHTYADAVLRLVKDSSHSSIRAIGCHGQTVRHRPDLGYTIQLANPALLAELTGISVVADFRTRDIAAGGQGAPLVPAFHAAFFLHPSIHRVIVNIGGIANLTNLPPSGNTNGFDCGPGNVLLDGWIGRIQKKRFDRNGTWAATGTTIPGLLSRFLGEPFFTTPPPKSTGRDLFNLTWLESYSVSKYAPEDVQATLVDLTARGIVDSITRHCIGAQEVFLCGGGTHNDTLTDRLKALLPTASWKTTNEEGLPVDCVEATAFAWLAKQTLTCEPGNLPAVTGAQGKRILGAVYPA